MVARLPRRYVVVTLAGIAFAVAVIAAVMIFPMAIQSSSNSSANDPLRIAVVTDALFTDRGWGASSRDAAEFIASKYESEVATEDNVEIADIESTLRKYPEARYDLVIAHGFQWGEPALRVAKQHPDTKFVVFTGLVQSSTKDERTVFGASAFWSCTAPRA